MMDLIEQTNKRLPEPSNIKVKAPLRTAIRVGGVERNIALGKTLNPIYPNQVRDHLYDLVTFQNVYNPTARALESLSKRKAAIYAKNYMNAVKANPGTNIPFDAVYFNRYRNQIPSFLRLSRGIVPGLAAGSLAYDLLAPFIGTSLAHYNDLVNNNGRGLVKQYTEYPHAPDERSLLNGAY